MAGSIASHERLLISAVLLVCVAGSAAPQLQPPLSSGLRPEEHEHLSGTLGVAPQTTLLQRRAGRRAAALAHERAVALLSDVAVRTKDPRLSVVIPLWMGIIGMLLILASALAAMLILHWRSKSTTKKTVLEEESLGTGRYSPPELLACMVCPVVSYLVNIVYLIIVVRGRSEFLESLKWCAVYFVPRMVCFSILALAKHAWLRIIGVPSDQIAQCYISVPLDKAWLAKYGEGRIMILDGVIRKTAHIFGFVWWTIVAIYMPTDYILPATLLHGVMVLTQEMALFKVYWRPTDYIFWPCARIRDGRLGRLNALAVGGSGSLAMVFKLSIWEMVLSQAVTSPVIHKAILVAITAPCFLGDAMAEIVGVLVGYHRFPVYGLGERNDKSIEGCLGMFLSTVLYTAVMIWYLGLPLWGWWILMITIGVTSTAMETATPRGFDNLTIPITSCLCVAVWLQAGWSPDV